MSNLTLLLLLLLLLFLCIVLSGDGSFMALGYGSGLDIFSQPGSVGAAAAAGGGGNGGVRSASGNGPGSIGNRHPEVLFDIPGSGEQRSPGSSAACGNGLSTSLTPMRSPYLTTVQQHLPSMGGGARTGEQAAASRLVC